MITPLSMSLYKLCMCTIIKNVVEVDFFLPLHLLEDIKLLKSLNISWNKRKLSYNQYFLALAALGEVSWETLSCSECENNFHWLDQNGHCFTHSSLISYEIQNQRELKLAYDIATSEYGDEKERCQKQSPHLQDIVEYLEGATTFDIDLWQAI